MRGPEPPRRRRSGWRRRIAESASYLLRWRAEQPAGILVFKHPHGAVGRDFDVADAVADAPAFGGRRASLAVECDAIERLGRHAAHQRRSLPRRKHRAVIEGQIAWRDDRRPVDHRLREIAARVGTRDRYTVVVDGVRDKRPAVVLPGLDQIELVASSRSVLDFPQPAIRREGETVRRSMTRGPRFGEGEGAA